MKIIEVGYGTLKKVRIGGLEPLVFIGGPCAIESKEHAFKMAERRNEGYYLADVLSDALGRDKSSRLYVALKKGKQLVSEIGAYITGSLDDGLLVISGKLNDGITFQQLDQALWEELDKMKSDPLPIEELKRLKVKLKTSREFEEQGLLNRAMNLCQYELLGDANGINEEAAIYDAIQPIHLQEMAIQLFQQNKLSVLKVNANPNA
jgi:predicted Zn-dependent peptidase